MPLIHISHAQSFDAGSNENIIAAVSRAYAESSGAPIEKVSVILEEVPRNQWGTGGRSLAARDSD